MQISIRAILSIQLVLVLLFACGILLENIFLGEQSIAESKAHGEEAVSSCFDLYLESIQTNGEAFIKDISQQLRNHVGDVVEYAEEQARTTATAVERTGFMEVMETNGWHGSQKLPLFGWMLLGPLEKKNDDNAVVADFVVATLNSTEDFNNWVWFGLGSRNPNPVLDCSFYYYRNATDKMSNLWCLEELYQDPGQPTPSPYPHLTSPGIIRLQEATPCIPPNESNPTPLVWMPLDFFVWTRNTFALTSVVSSVFGPNGTCQGFAAANVRFSSMSSYLSSLVESARYANLNIALIETSSGTILGTSLGSAIYTSHTFFEDATYEEQELAANLSQMNNSLAAALNAHIQESYGNIENIPTPLITSAVLEGEAYYLSFDAFSRGPLLDLTIIAFIPQLSITGATEAQRNDAQIELEESAENLEHRIDMRVILQIALGVGGLLACAVVACITAGYISIRIQEMVNFMERLRAKISDLVEDDKKDPFHPSSSLARNLFEPLPIDYFPIFGATRLADINMIQAATEDLCAQLLETWNRKQVVFRKALEQRQFTASIAHDIRNPLHGVLGIVSMMQSNIEEHKDKLPMLADTLNHMSTLLNDMVDLSKIQGGKVTHSSKTFNACDIFHEICLLYKSEVGSKGGSLSFKEDARLPLAYSDPVHVRRILTNFVSNATKYAPGCEIQLQARAATREQVESRTFLSDAQNHFGKAAPQWSDIATLDHQEYIVLSCLDKGRGIPPSKLDTVFVAYQQARASDRYQGAGLGLAIVRGLAVEMGGGIGVQSQLGSGSLFWLAVPSCSPTGEALPPPSKNTPVERSSVSPSTATSATEDSSDPSPYGEEGGFSQHVLVVDDTNLNLMLMGHFLTRLGVKSVKSSSAKDGLKKLREDPDKFCLILSDLDMPEMTGGEMCLEIRKDKRLCHLPFICTSGNHLTKEEKEAYKIDDSLMKPFTVDQVQAAIQPYMNQPSKCPPSLVSTEEKLAESDHTSDSSSCDPNME